MTTECKLRGGTGKSVFFVTVETPRMVALSVGEEAQRLIGIAGKIREIYHVGGGWMAEAFRENDQTLSLFLLCVSPARKRMELNFEAGAVSLSVNPGDGWETPCSGRFERAASLTLTPHQSVIVRTEEEEPESRSTPLPDIPDYPPEPRSFETAPAAETDNQEELERLQASLSHAQEELRTLQIQNQALQSAIAQRMDEDYFPYLRQREASLGTELAERIRRGELAEARLSRLRRDVESAKSMGEVRELDIERSERELSELRSRFGLDSDTAALMESDAFFSAGTVGEALEKAASALDEAETQIRRVIQARERFNRDVQDSILTGNGSVSSDE